MRSNRKLRGYSDSWFTGTPITCKHLISLLYYLENSFIRWFVQRLILYSILILRLDIGFSKPVCE